jgi:hypothetical protein
VSDERIDRTSPESGEPVDRALTALYRAHLGADSAASPSGRADARIRALAREALESSAAPSRGASEPGRGGTRLGGAPAASLSGGAGDASGWRAWLATPWFKPSLAFAALASISVVIIALMPKEELGVEREAMPQRGTEMRSDKATTVPAEAEAPRNASAGAQRDASAAPQQNGSAVPQRPSAPVVLQPRASAVEQPDASIAAQANAPVAAQGNLSADVQANVSGAVQRDASARAPAHAPVETQPKAKASPSPNLEPSAAAKASAPPADAARMLSPEAAPPATKVEETQSEHTLARQASPLRERAARTESTADVAQRPATTTDARPNPFPATAPSAAPSPAFAPPAPAAPAAPSLEARDAVAASAEPLQKRSFEGLTSRVSPAHRDPAEWMRAILKLRSEGKIEQMSKELAEFRKTFPVYPIPEALK